MSSTNQNRKKKKNGKITAAEKQHSLQVKALHIFSARIYFFKDTSPLPYPKNYVELLKWEGGGGGWRNLIFTLFPILTKPAQTEI